MNLNELVDGSLISPDKIALALKTTKREISHTLGIVPEALTHKRTIQSPAVQTSLRHLVETLNTVTPAVGSPLMAYAWFRSEAIVGFGGRTPAEIIQDGEAEGLKAHILRRMEVGYA